MRFTCAVCGEESFEFDDNQTVVMTDTASALLVCRECIGTDDFQRKLNQLRQDSADRFLETVTILRR